MSRKNHKLIGEKLLQTDKKFSALKGRQKEKIAQWMYEETLSFFQIRQESPKGTTQDEIVNRVYSLIEKAEIWIPYEEVQKHYRAKLTVIVKRCKKQIDTQEIITEN